MNSNNRTNRSAIAALLKGYMLLSVLLLAQFSVNAQELNCKVKVLHEKITKVDPQVFTSMERAITEFINNRKWSSDEFNTIERIECSMLINLTSNNDNDPDIWNATISVQATRPVFNSNYNTPLLNTVDRDLVFRYTQFNPLTFDDNRVSGNDPLASNLTAVIAYYSYLILGLDYDSFSPNGGTAFLKKAQNVVNNAPEDAGIKGWKAFEEKRNRYWIIDQLMSPRFATFRTAWYTIHREGLDIMWSKPDDGRAKVLGTLTTIQNILRDNQQSTLIQGFFNAKSDEITRMVMQGSQEERTRYLSLLAQIDPVNAGKYSALK